MFASGQPRRVIICGSTGSIGTQALAICAAHSDRFAVAGLSAGGGQPELLAQQVWDFNVRDVAVSEPGAGQRVHEALVGEAQRRGRSDELAQVKIRVGAEAVAELAGAPADVVLNGIAGAAGLPATLAALQAGTILALANKESLIMGGPLVAAMAQPGQIVPVDSEHSALAQALLAGAASEVRRLVLTASGGPFRGRSRHELAGVTVAQALDHPTWSMGPLVTINSATMINKGLEVIEAHLLFDLPFAAIDVVVHPQSVVHSMVEFVDGSTMAQASPPDMRIPIALGLDWPHRLPDIAPGCDWTKAATWEFYPLDTDAFPAVDVARRAGAAGGLAPAVFNAADEIAVAAFLAGEIDFTGIVDTVAAVVDRFLTDPALKAARGNEITLASVLEADSLGRDMAQALVR